MLVKTYFERLYTHMREELYYPNRKNSGIFCAATRFNQNRRHNTIREISFGEYKRFPGAELRETVIVKTPVH